MISTCKHLLKTIIRCSVKVIFKLDKLQPWFENIYHVSLSSRCSNGTLWRREKERISVSNVEGRLWEKEGGMKGSEVGCLRATSSGIKTGFVLSSDSEQEVALCLSSLLASVWLFTKVIDTQYTPMKTAGRFYLCCAWYADTSGFVFEF